MSEAFFSELFMKTCKLEEKERRDQSGRKLEPGSSLVETKSANHTLCHIFYLNNTKSTIFRELFNLLIPKYRIATATSTVNKMSSNLVKTIIPPSLPTSLPALGLSTLCNLVSIVQYFQGCLELNKNKNVQEFHF